MYIGIDIGGSKTLFARFNKSGDIVESKKIKTPKDFSDFQAELIQQVADIAGTKKIEAIAVAAPGLINYDTNTIKAFGNLAWKNIDLITPLTSFCKNVFIENDANLGALGEANHGAGKGFKTSLYVTLSTGIGTGVTYEGRLTDVLRRSEGGMMEFSDGNKQVLWENIASGKAFYEKFHKFGSEDTNPEHWAAWAKEVALGFNELIAIVQPDVIVIGGSMGVHIDKYHAKLVEEITHLQGKTIEMPQIVPALHPEEAVIIGCYELCRQKTE